MRKKAHTLFAHHLIRKIFTFFFRPKHLLISLTLISIIISICCSRQVLHHKVLPVPFKPQLYNGWCAAACVQMWAEYDNNHPSQEDIARIIGWEGVSPRSIAYGVGFFTRTTGVDFYLPGSAAYQNSAIASQVVSVDDNIPSVSIVKSGTHAVIVIGFNWTWSSSGRPIAEGVYFHDPLSWAGEETYQTAESWKRWWFDTYNGREFAFILGYFHHLGEGESGYADFLAAGGTYYGGPEDYDSEKEPPLMY
jgi:hypothetical protein